MTDLALWPLRRYPSGLSTVSTPASAGSTFTRVLFPGQTKGPSLSHARPTSSLKRSVHLSHRTPGPSGPLRRRLYRRRLRADALDVRGHHVADRRGRDRQVEGSASHG